MEIALFGGSFDPPHVGHLLAAHYVLATEPVDELWLLPVFRHPLTKKARTPFEHRADLCERLAALLGPRARVSRLEASVPGEGRTVDLLEHLHASRPGDRFALVLGSDLAAERPQWKRFARIAELSRVIELARGGFPAGAGDQAPAEAAGTGGTGAEPQRAGVILPAVSSSQVRALLVSGGDASRLVPRAVLEAIQAAGTYR
ncbi:MAG: nicotinate-nucleotide adenylyltransferase [Myxococcales bacterium]